MTKTPLIAPSILSADFARMGQEVEAISQAGADWIHVDVMDGHFVGQITFGPAMIKAIRPYTQAVIDAHLMISPVDVYLPDVVAAGADSVTLHVEAGPHVHRSVQRIKELGARAGVSINPGTPLSAVEPLLDDVDVVLLMSVNPGFGGQAFIEASVQRCRTLAALRGDRPVLIEIDGGVGPGNAERLVEAGADVLVAGSTVFAGADTSRTPAAYAANMADIRSAAVARTGLVTAGG